MDKKAVLKLLAGTVARGLLWAVAGISASLGVKGAELEEDAAYQVSYWAVSVVAAIAASLWSKGKDQKLLGQLPVPKDALP